MQPAMRSTKAGAYQSVAAWSSMATAEPERLVVMLYDGALDRIGQARGCMQHGAAADKSRYICRALEIIGELRGSLDHARGGPLAGNLNDLYEYMERRLVEANAANQPEKLDEVMGLLRELRQAWAALASRP